MLSQVKFRSFAKLLFFLDPQPEDRLLVLGCDAGSCVMASALLYDLGQIQAVESMQARSATNDNDTRPRVRCFYPLSGAVDAFSLLIGWQREENLFCRLY